MEEWKYSHTFVTSALDGGKLSDLRPGYFTPGLTTLGPHWIGDWVGPTAGLDAVAKKKIPASVGNWTPAVQPVT
jgi:hypothetical protein